MATPILIVLLLFALVIIYALYRKYKDQQMIHRATVKDLKQQYNSYYGSQTLYGIIHQVLRHMDELDRYYENEDSANRELAVALNVLGHKAHFHKKINGRETDIFVDNTIIEGKLEPSNTEVDRLIGQVSDYLTSIYNVIIVIYGTVSSRVVERINSQLIERYPNRVRLVFIQDAKRTKLYNNTY